VSYQQRKVVGGVLLETEIVKGLKEGREEILEAMIGSYGPSLFRYALALLGREEDARDVVQETFIRAFRQAGALKEAAAFKGWLYKITLNLSRDTLARRGKRVEVLTENLNPLTEPSPSAEEAYLALEKCRELKTALLGIPLHYREVILLYYYRDFSIKEISMITGRPEGTVKSLLSRGRKLLQSYFTERGL
jgi:RNA polymerase sigma-70 factor, ECF subfamily